MLVMAQKVLAHPFDFFYDIQFQDRAKWRHALLLLAVAVAVRIMSLSITGYSFEGREPYQISFVFEIVWTVVPWMAWCISNWAVSTLLDGEGTFKHIVVSSSYALVPYIILTLPTAVLSRILSQDESSIYSFLISLAYVWVVLLFLIKVKVLHDFEIGKLFWITILTLIGMFIIAFAALLVYGLVNQVIDFFVDIYKELSFRS